MDLLGELTSLQDFKEYKVNETLKAKFLTLVFREYRKFKEVANIRHHKKSAIRLLDRVRASAEREMAFKELELLQKEHKLNNKEISNRKNSSQLQ